MNKYLVLGLAALLLTTVLSPETALAGGRGKGGGGTTTNASLWVEPNGPFPANGYDFMVRGSGFNPNSAVNVSLTVNGSCCLAFNAAADGSGNIAFAWETGAAGSYTFRAYQDKQGQRWNVYGQVSFEVY